MCGTSLLTPLNHNPYPFPFLPLLPSNSNSLLPNSLFLPIHRKSSAQPFQIPLYLFRPNLSSHSKNPQNPSLPTSSVPPYATTSPYPTKSTLSYTYIVYIHRIHLIIRKTKINLYVSLYFLNSFSRCLSR